MVILKEIMRVRVCVLCGSGGELRNASIGTKRHVPWLQTHACTVYKKRRFERNALPFRRTMHLTEMRKGSVRIHLMHFEHDFEPVCATSSAVSTFLYRNRETRARRRAASTGPRPGVSGDRAMVRPRSARPTGAPQAGTTDRPAAPRAGLTAGCAASRRQPRTAADHEMQLQMIDGMGILRVLACE